MRMLHDQRSSEKKSIWEVLDTMPTVTEITPTSAHGSQIYPRYSPDNHQTQQYKQAWIVENHPSNDNMDMKSRCGPNKRCILTVLLMGILIGLFLCGIPLAVMTTLYLQQKSQTSSSSTSTGSSGTSSTSFVSLPSQCASYMSNTDSTRNSAYTSCGGCYCDDSSTITTGWYRFSGGAGTRLVTAPVSINRCGANYPGWFNGSLPSTVGSTTTGTVCANYNGNLCYSPYSVSSVLVTNCDSFYVFYLTPISSSCNTRYCTT